MKNNNKTIFWSFLALGLLSNSMLIDIKSNDKRRDVASIESAKNSGQHDPGELIMAVPLDEKKVDLSELEKIHNEHQTIFNNKLKYVKTKKVKLTLEESENIYEMKKVLSDEQAKIESLKQKNPNQKEVSEDVCIASINKRRMTNFFKKLIVNDVQKIVDKMDNQIESKIEKNVADSSALLMQMMMMNMMNMMAMNNLMMSNFNRTEAPKFDYYDQQKVLGPTHTFMRRVDYESRSVSESTWQDHYSMVQPQAQFQRQFSQGPSFRL